MNQNFSGWTEKQAIEYAFVTGLFPKEFLDAWEMREGDFRDFDKASAAVKEWKQQGFTTKKRSYAVVVRICGVRRKQAPIT